MRYVFQAADLSKYDHDAAMNKYGFIDWEVNTNMIKAQEEELKIYEEKIHHLADKMIEIYLDDGVKVNYARFQVVLAKI